MQEAVGAHARVPAVRVRALPVLAAPTGRALIHICQECRGLSSFRDELPASPAHRAKPFPLLPRAPPAPELTLAGPINPLKAGWTRSIWGAYSV